MCMLEMPPGKDSAPPCWFYRWRKARSQGMQWLLEAGNNSQFTASKNTGPQPYSCKQLYSTNSLHE